MTLRGQNVHKKGVPHRNDFKINKISCSFLFTYNTSNFCGVTKHLQSVTFKKESNFSIKKNNQKKKPFKSLNKEKQKLKKPEFSGALATLLCCICPEEQYYL